MKDGLDMDAMQIDDDDNNSGISNLEAPAMAMEGDSLLSDREKSEQNAIALVKIDNAQIVANLLAAINFPKDMKTCVSVHPEGWTFRVEESSALQGKILLHREIFHTYKLKKGYTEEDPLRFTVNLSNMIDCLNIFGHSNFTTLSMVYTGYGDPFLLALHEGAVFTDCGLSPIEDTLIEDYDFNGPKGKPNRIMIRSEALKEALNELDWSSEEACILMSPDPPHFRLASQTQSGSLQVDYPRNSEVFEAFECVKTNKAYYKMRLFKPIVRALANATRTQIRMNINAMLEVTHVYNSDRNGKITTVEFLLHPSILDTEDDVNML
eukprot:TRINITY_DN19770_c0_g1_i1.p1 TRINITY_DN19770_c0_g1~~TRINITY_DN19770_c0_g1_i1.p1  ORF type:complete len:323 (-),score=55.84 TRINITY_DN19770_c0_g1_i1:42-1010(-)